MKKREPKTKKIPVNMTLPENVIEMMNEAREVTKMSQAQFMAEAIVEYVETRKQLAKLKEMTLGQIIEKSNIKKKAEER